MKPKPSVNYQLLHSRTFFFTVLLLSSIGLVVTDVYLPSLPFIEADLATTKSIARLSLSFYLLSFSLSQLYYGPLSDRIGRRKVAFLGLWISMLGSILCLFSFSISFLILGRFIQGLGLGAGSTLARSIRRDVHSGNDLAHFGSYIIVGTSVLFAIAPAIGGLIQHYTHWRINFLFILLYTLFALFCVKFWLPETHKVLNPLATKGKSLFRHYLILLKNPVFMGSSLSSAFAFGGLAAYFTLSPFLFEKVLGFTPLEYGGLGFIIALGLGSGGFFNKQLIHFLGRRQSLIIGLSHILISGILMLTFSLFSLLNTFVIMLPMFLYAFGASITFTNSFALAMTPFSHGVGFAAALFGCMQILGGAIASGVIVAIQPYDQTSLSLILIIISMGVNLFQIIAVRYRTKSHVPFD
jgi:MFS transporter, DHA1 family, 2-module integral membrane pump EmrD